MELGTESSHLGVGVGDAGARGQLLAGCSMALNGRAGAMYRIPFPVLCCSSWGPWGALWPTFDRADLSIVWKGVDSVQGAECL